MKIFTLLLSLLICGVTNATTYYISPTGNDNTGNGSIGNPWKTLSKATSTVTTAGDIIHVNAGTYTETQTCNLSRGVSIEGDGMSTTIMNSTLAGTWSTFLELQSANNTNGAQSISGLTIDGGYVSESNVKTWVGIWITGRSNVLIHDLKLRNWKQSSTIFNGNTNTNPGTDVGQSFATGNKFYNNIVTNSAAMYQGTGQGALMLGFQIGMEIYGNDISQTQRPNFFNGWPIKYWNQGWLKGVKIYNNTLTKIPYSGSYPGENGNWDFAIEFFNIEGLEVYGNTIQGAIDMAYNYKGAYAHCAWIHDNTLSHPVQGTRVEGAIIFEYRAEAALVENNIINNKTYGVTFNTRGVAENGDDRYYLPGGPPVGGYSYVVDCIIRKNLFSNMYNGTGMGNRFGIGVISDGPEDPQINNMQIYNNTMTAASGDPCYLGMDFTSQQNGNCQGLYIRNNIVTGFSMGWLRGSNGATNITNCMVTHNNGFGNGSNTPTWPAGNPGTYTYTNNISLNPLFVSIVSWLLQPLSPCINSGVNVGLPYSGSAPDMGYAEYGSILPGPTPPVVGAITQPTCAVATGSVALSGLPLLAWTLTRSPGGNTTTGVGTTTTITGLPSGTYTYTVTDLTGTSTSSANIVINAQPATPTAPAVGTITQPTCAVATGSVALSGLPATGTWTLTRSPGGTTTTGTGATTTITGLAAGTYTYTVTNAGGCISPASGNIVITAQPGAPTAPTVGTITQPTCAVATGSVVINGLPATGTWTLTRTPGGTTTTGTGTTTTITGLAAGTYTYTVTNVAGCTSAASANVVINAQPATPTAPTVGTITQPTVPVPTGTVILNGLPATGTWTLTRTPGGIITTGTGTTTTITGLAAGTYTYTVTNAAGCTSVASAPIVINPVAANIPPVANAGANQTITLPTNFIIVSGSGTDPDGTVVGFLWTKVSGPANGTITNPGMAATSITGLVQGVYQFELRVTDNNGAFGRDTMQVTVNPAAANIPPTANAGPDQTITLPTNFIIVSGSGTDPDGTVVGYLWTKISGPANGIITNPTTAASSITGLVQGTYRFELRVTDNSGAFGRDTMQVIVNAGASNIPPVANAGADQTITLPISSTIISGSGTDADGTVVAYLWTKVAGPASGTITNPNTAASSVTGLAQGVYQFELRVTDNNGAFGRDTIQVTVNAGASNIPPVANAGPDQTITLPTNSIIISGSGTDPDGTVVAYLWTKVSGPAAGTITNATTAASSVTGLAQGTYRFELRVTDNNGAFGRDTMQVTVNAGAPNTPPVANAGPDQTITLPTNSVVLSGSGTDPNGSVVAYLWTKISGPANGTITNPNAAGSAVTGLVQGVYKFELRVTDNNGAFGRDTMQVTVNPGATNTPPTANAGPDQTITLPVNSVILSGSGIDPDGTIVAYLWTKISGPAGGTITNPNTAATSVTGLAQGVYQIELRVTDNSGAFGRDTMQVTVNPIGSNNPPTADAGPDQTITLPVNSVILSGSGTDTDGTIVAYMWTKVSGPVGGTITNPNTAATAVTGLAQGVYQFELRVTDNTGDFGRDTVQVTVNPIGSNASPTADAGPDQTITLPVSSTIVSGSGNDPDGIIVDYLWTKISGPAGSTITNPNIAATAITGLVQGVYQFELRVTDNTGAFGRDTMEITVNDAPNVAPEAHAGPDQTIVAPSITTASSINFAGSGTDPDGIIVAYNWTKISGPGAGNITNPTSASSSATGLVIGTYEFELKVTDDDGAFGRDTMLVTISAPPNVLPTANAGPDRSLVLPANSTTLTGSGTDVDGTIVSYDWKQISGPSTNVLFSLTTATTYLNNLVEGTYEFELTVTDNRGGQAKDNVLVIVTGTQTTIVVHDNEASIYPNPVVTTATLDIKSKKLNSVLTVMVTDIQGKNVYRKDLTATQYSIKEKLDMSNLRNGPYIVTVYFDNGEKQTMKVIKQ